MRRSRRGSPLFLYLLGALALVSGILWLPPIERVVEWMSENASFTIKTGGIEEPDPLSLHEMFDPAGALELAGDLVALKGSALERTEQARLLLESRFQTAGWQANRESFIDPEVSSERVFVNVRFSPKIARGGPFAMSPKIRLVSRYDFAPSTFSPRPGALESASGPALLVEVARVLASSPSVAQMVEMLLVDGSAPMIQYSAEDGLRGSRADVARPISHPNPVIVVIGCVGGKEQRLTLPTRSSRSLASITRRLIADHQIDLRLLSIDRPLWADDLPYLAGGNRALLLGDFDSYTLGTADDTMAGLSAESFLAFGNLVLRLIVEHL